MKTLYVEIEFEDDAQQSIAKVSDALKDFEISHLSWVKQQKQDLHAPHYRAAKTLKDNLGGN